MLKYGFFLLLQVVIFSSPIKSQIIQLRLIFPEGYNTTPSARMKGKVQKVINISSLSGKPYTKVIEDYKRDGSLESSTKYFTGEEHKHFEIELSGPIGKDLFTYDENDKNLLETRSISGNGERHGVAKYFYDINNRTIRSCIYGADETLRNEKMFFYDTIKKIITIKSKRYHESGTTIDNDIVFHYNNKNRITKRINLDEKGKPKITTDFKYDVYGNVTKEVVDEYVYTYRYWFDKNRNWIKKVKYFRLKREVDSDKREHIITIRKIKYY
jgi:hypothetical protein